VTALRIRDEGGPALCGQVMAYASTDYFAKTQSRIDFATGFGFTMELMKWFRAFYLRSEDDGHHPYVSPMRAASLAGLPPAFVISAEYDPMRDEGEAYGARLAASNVPTQVSRYDGLNHGFLFWAGKIDPATAAISEIGAWLQRTFSAR
jgi:acetyl esterase